MGYSVSSMSSPSPTGSCPTCGKKFRIDPLPPDMPFCSKRCRLADLNRWMSEEIGIPAGSSEEEDEKEPAPPPPPREWRFD